MSRTLFSLPTLVPALLSIVLAAPAADVTIVPFDGSPIPIGAGARALGMGGAFTAVADDATANTWNPAGMAQLERPEFSLNGGWYYRSTSADGGDSSTQSDLALDHVSVVWPFFVLGTQQTVGIAWQRQFDFTRQADSTQALQSQGQVNTQGVSNNSVDNEGAWSTWSLSYAADVTPTLSLGGTLLIWNDNLTGYSHNDRSASSTGTLTTFTPGAPPTLISDETFTATQDQRITIDRGVSLVLGAMWQVAPAWTLAATLKPRYDLDLSIHKQDERIFRDAGTGAITSQQSSDTRRSATYTYPTSATLATAWRANDSQTVTLDVTWTHWRDLKIETDGATTSPISPFVSPSEFDDGYALRIGYEHVLLLPRVVLVPRCGLLYEGLPGVTAAPDNAHPELVNATVDRYWGATAGVSVFQRTILYDAAVQLRYGKGVGSGVDAPFDASADVLGVTVRAGFTYHF
jgi:long-subunit fatty acid transport protein